MQWVTRELYEGNWVSTYFNSAAAAKKLMRKIMKAGGAAICLRAVR
jgi:hypothetical protein